MRSPSTTVPRSNAGHRRRISAASIHSYGTPTASRLDRYGPGSIAAPGGNRSTPPVRVMIGVVAVAFDVRPRVVRRCGQLDVAGRVIRAADDAGVVVRGAAHVAELELLEPDHVDTTAGQPVRRRRAEPAETDDPDGELAISHRHASPPRTSD